MDINKKLIAILILSLVAGAGLAGGLYVVSTPTDIAPKAADGTGFSSENPPSRPSPAPLSGAGTSPTTPPLTEKAIISAFGTKSAVYDLNADGSVNTLDLLEFRKKQ